MPEPQQPVAVGQWSRVMTFGHKVQMQPGPDGPVAVPFDFTPETLCRAVENFQRLNKARRIPIDYNHKAADPTNPHPEAVQNLGGMSGLAVILGDEVIRYHDHYPDRPAPDPMRLRAALQEKFPRETDVGGLWAVCSEVTPLGADILPNVQDLSPWFFDNDVDEQGNEIGLRIATISVVPLGFQDKTTLTLGKWAQMNMPSSVGHTTAPAKGQNVAEEKEKKEGAEGGESSMLANLRKLTGLPDDASDDAVMGALTVKLAQCEARPAEAEETAEAKAAKLAKDEEIKAAAMSADAAKDATMSKVVSAALARQNATLAEQGIELAKLKKEKDDADKRDKATKFAKSAIAAGQHPADDLENLVELEIAGQSARVLKPRGTFTLGRQTIGGNPQGYAGRSITAETGTTWSKTTSGSPVKGATLAKLAGELADKEKIDYGAAQRRVLKEHPHLYEVR